jgi:cobalt-zinc-cadmium resistance protein CzcA
LRRGLLLDKFPEVDKIVGKTGSSKCPLINAIDASDMIIVLKDKSEWTSTFDELSEKMANELEAVPGVSYGFQYPVQMRLMS